jgi:hypothetical protein
MMGHVDLKMGRAAHQLSEAGHTEMSDLVHRQVVGRNVFEGRWTFELVVEFDAC